MGSSVSSPSPSTSRYGLVALLVGTSILLAIIVWPLAAALFLAAVFAGLLWPLQQRCARLLRGARGLSAGLVVAATMILVAVPVVALSAAVVRQSADAVTFVSATIRQSGLEGLIRDLPEPLSRLVRNGLQRLPRERHENIEASVQRKLNEQSGTAVAVVGTAISATGSLAFQTLLMMIALYFLLFQGDQFVAWLDENSPLERGQTRELLLEFQRVSAAVISSTLFTAAAQAGAALVGYLIAGVPQPLFATAVTFVFAFIPGVGGGAAALAIAGLVALSGRLYWALFLALWGLLVVGLADNFVRPLLIRRGVGIHGAILFFSLIGGVKAFGALGLLLGPLSVALFLAVLRMYRRGLAGVNPQAARA